MSDLKVTGYCVNCESLAKERDEWKSFYENSQFNNALIIDRLREALQQYCPHVDLENNECRLCGASFLQRE